MLRRYLIPVGLCACLLTATAGSALATPATHSAKDGPTSAESSWRDQRVMNMAHSGGEMEAPANTMYAFKRAVALGSDMIELDVQSTSEDDLVVMHDAKVAEATNGTGKVTDMTTGQVQALDAAHNFVPDLGTEPDQPADSYPLRGIRTGEQPPLEGYSPDDFAFPTLKQVFTQFPDIPINIEIKGTSTLNVKSYVHNAELLAEFLKDLGRSDVIVTSFNDIALSKFHKLAPEVSLAPSTAGLAAYYFTGKKPIDGTVALQIPVTLYGTTRIATPKFIKRAHADGYAVHVWFSGTADEDEATYNTIVDACADALMPARPQFLEQLLDDRGIARPGQPGNDPCG